MRTLIIDNYDSFTFNLYQLIAAVNGEEPIVIRNDEMTWEELCALRVDNIVISPGPGRPEVERDFGICRRVIVESPLPILGVCLGHEGIGAIFGGTVAHAPEVMHGRLSLVHHDGSELFAGIPQEFAVVRYHSLIVPEPLPSELAPIAWTSDGVLMGLRHRARPLWGVQFHPESICTEHGSRLLRNFRDITARLRGEETITHSFSGFTPAVRGAGRESGECRVSSRRLGHLYDPEKLFLGLMAKETNAFWLDSSRVEEGLSRFSFIGNASGPHAEVVRYDCASRTLTIEKGGATETIDESIFEYLDRELARRRTASEELPFDFNCGFVGYFGYELKAECGAEHAHRSPYPDASFIFADRVIAFDHTEGETYLLAFHPAGKESAAQRWLDEIQLAIDALTKQEEPWQQREDVHEGEPITFHLSRDRATYLNDIAESLREIHEGESYEICLTNQISARLSLDPLELYRTLRRVNPAPYAAFLRFGDLALLSSSPERFLRVERSGWVESKPIKGTRPRGRTPEDDEAIRRELAGSMKDRAENMMIVDLIRNDLGRVCEVGSVHVPKLMDVESYATVHQLVSTIRGLLREDRSTIDCIRSAFPGGSMTGAPKIRTMEIIDRLEREARGIYSGAIGFLGLNGSADLNIVIRTIVMTPGLATMGVGGAIVSLSDPESEFEEMLLKAEAQIDAIARTAGVEGEVRGTLGR